MRVLTITELMRLSRIELCDLLARITAVLRNFPVGSVEQTYKGTFAANKFLGTVAKIGSTAWSIEFSEPLMRCAGEGFPYCAQAIMIGFCIHFATSPNGHRVALVRGLPRRLPRGREWVLWSYSATARVSGASPCQRRLLEPLSSYLISLIISTSFQI